MSTHDVVHTDVIEITTATCSLPNGVREMLEQFTLSHYHIANSTTFNEHVLGLGKRGELALFYDKHNKLVGFTRICRQVLQSRGKSVTVYFGNTYHIQEVNPYLNAAQWGLSKAMQFKLAHPEEEMVYFSYVNTPTKYQFLATLSNTIYPKKNSRVPKSVLSLVTSLKNHNHWSSHPAHPMIIREEIPFPNLSSTHHKQPETTLTKDYTALNPDYKTGHSLLVYLPLNLANIGLGIKHLMKTPC